MRAREVECVFVVVGRTSPNVLTCIFQMNLSQVFLFVIKFAGPVVDELFLIDHREIR